MAKTNTKVKAITLDELRIHVSGEFLCDNLPKNFRDLEEEELDEWLVDNAWQPFENDSPSDIWEWIDDAALALKMFLEKRGIKVVGI